MPARKKTDTASETETDLDFEASLASLEEIVAAMEEEQLPLEELVAKYEQGIQLLGRCETVLAAAKKRLITISARHAGAPGGEDSLDAADRLPHDAPAVPDGQDDDDDIRLF